MLNSVIIGFIEELGRITEAMALDPQPDYDAAQHAMSKLLYLLKHPDLTTVQYQVLVEAKRRMASVTVTRLLCDE